MKSYRPYSWPLNQDSIEDRHRWDDVLTTRGGKRPPERVRNLLATSGLSKATVTWTAPVQEANVGGYRVYLDTEDNLVQEIKDPSATSCDVVLNDTDQHNFFVTAVSKLGTESPLTKVVSSSSGIIGWDSVAQKAAAVDVSGNLLLKNIGNAIGSTPSPTKSTGTLSTIPEMTQTITTKGNKVLVIWQCNISGSNAAGRGSFVISRDGVSLTTMSVFCGTDDTVATSSYVDSGASAGSHTYEIKWASTGGSPTLATLTAGARQMQVVELG